MNLNLKNMKFINEKVLFRQSNEIAVSKKFLFEVLKILYTSLVTKITKNLIFNAYFFPEVTRYKGILIKINVFIL